MMASPQLLIEGMIITSYAIGCHHAFLYVRGEVLHVVPPPAARHRGGARGGLPGHRHPRLRLRPGDHAARRCGRVHLRRGDGAARLARGPARPAAAQAAVPRGRRPVRAADRGEQRRVDRVGAEHRPGRLGLVQVDGHRSARPGYGLFSLSGHVTRPGQYEAPLGITLRELLEMAGGIREGHELKFWTPGGSSTPIFTAEHLDVPLDYESVGAAGSMLGTRALQIFDETTSVVRAVTRWTEFYKHESCGKCTPCREGTYWLTQVLQRHRGTGRARSPTSTCCSTCATTSWARRSARSATAPPARSRRRCSTSATSSRPGRTPPPTCCSRRSAARCSPTRPSTTLVGVHA